MVIVAEDASVQYEKENNEYDTSNTKVPILIESVPKGKNWGIISEKEDRSLLAVLDADIASSFEKQFTAKIMTTK